MPKTIGKDFNADVAINRFKLEEENELQPSLHNFYASQQIEAKASYTVAKDLLEVTEARRELYYRKNPPNDLKITEAVITALVIDDTEVQNAKEALRVAEKTLNTLDIAVGIIASTRRSALGNLTDLYTKEYYNNSNRQEEPANSAISGSRRNKE